MRKISLIIIIMIISSCANPFKKDNDPVENQNKSQQLKDKKDFYLSLMSRRADINGWLDYSCDSLLFNTFYEVSGGDPAILKAEDNGRWFRTWQKDCWPDKSRSSMSHDMLIGLLLWAWVGHQTDVIERLIDRLKKSDWDLCEGDSRDPTACLVSPNLKATIYEIANNFGLDCDSSCDAARSIPQAWNPLEQGYVAHTTAVHWLIRGMIQNGLNDLQLDYLRAINNHNPNNALFEAVRERFTNGNYMIATNILLDEKYFPNDGLPTSANYCTDYLFQREQDNKDWMPCHEKAETHNGVDFVFAASIILDEI